MIPEKEKLTYAKPPDGWVCFHCGKRFTTVGSAEDHFGKTPHAVAGCVIKAGEERGILMCLRKMEDLCEKQAKAIRVFVEEYPLCPPKDGCGKCNKIRPYLEALASEEYLKHLTQTQMPNGEKEEKGKFMLVKMFDDAWHIQYVKDSSLKRCGFDNFRDLTKEELERAVNFLNSRPDTGEECRKVLNDCYQYVLHNGGSNWNARDSILLKITQAIDNLRKLELLPRPDTGEEVERVIRKAFMAGVEYERNEDRNTEASGQHMTASEAVESYLRSLLLSARRNK